MDRKSTCAGEFRVCEAAAPDCRPLLEQKLSSGSDDGRRTAVPVTKIRDGVRALAPTPEHAVGACCRHSAA